MQSLLTSNFQPERETEEEEEREQVSVLFNKHRLIQVNTKMNGAETNRTS